jgi:hypothetical protein
MLRRLCSIIGTVILLNNPPLTADDILPGNPPQGYRIGPDVVAEGSLPTRPDQTPEWERVRPDTQRSGHGQAAVQAAGAAAALARSPASQQTGLFLPWGELLDYWLASVQDLSLQVRPSPEVERRAALLWRPQAHAVAPTYRVDGALRLARSGSLARTDRNTVEGMLDATVEAQVGSTQKPRAANSVKGTLGTQMVFHPGSEASWSPGEKSFSEKNNSKPGKSGEAGVSFLLATKRSYEVNPSTGKVKTQSELAGSFHWLPVEQRFTQDPWGVIAFRWRPSVSCIGGGLLGTENTKAEETDAPQARLTGKVRGDLRLDFLTPGLVASGDYQYWQGLSSSPYAWHLTTLSWTYQFGAHVSLSGSFTQGKRLPSVSKERGLTMELRVMF